jgi:hypothetical protein
VTTAPEAPRPNRQKLPNAGGRRSDAALSSTVKRAADVLQALTDTAEVGVSELSRQLGWPKSVTHRVLTTLAHSGLVAVDASTHRYRLGPAALRLGLAAIARADVHRLAIPHLSALRDTTGETATLTLLSGDHRLYVEVVESPDHRSRLPRTALCRRQQQGHSRLPGIRRAGASSGFRPRCRARRRDAVGY